MNNISCRYSFLAKWKSFWVKLSYFDFIEKHTLLCELWFSIHVSLVVLKTTIIVRFTECGNCFILIQKKCLLFKSTQQFLKYHFSRKKFEILCGNNKNTLNKYHLVKYPVRYLNRSYICLCDLWIFQLFLNTDL